MSSDRFASIWLKLDRAKHHTDDLKRKIDAYLDSGPYEIGPNEEGDGQIVKNVLQPFPSDISVVLGDAVHNIRTALDHFAYEVATTGQGHVYFPVWTQPAAPKNSQWETKIKKEVPGARGDVLKALLAIEPYETGKHQWIWELHRLDIIDKHHLLVPIATTNPKAVVTMRLGDSPPISVDVHPVGAGEPVEPGTPLVSLDSTSGPEGAEVHADVQQTFVVAFREPQALKGLAVVDTLVERREQTLTLLKDLIPLV